MKFSLAKDQELFGVSDLNHAAMFSSPNEFANAKKSGHLDIGDCFKIGKTVRYVFSRHECYTGAYYMDARKLGLQRAEAGDVARKCNFESSPHYALFWRSSEGHLDVALLKESDEHVIVETIRNKAAFVINCHGLRALVDERLDSRDAIKY